MDPLVEKVTKIFINEFDKVDQPPTARQSTTHLIDLNDDCLRSIFEYLAPCDLLDIVGVSARFRTLGREIYAKKFKFEKFSIDYDYDYDATEDKLKLLCRFGDLIPDLKVYAKLFVFDGLCKILENCCRNNLTILCIQAVDCLILDPNITVPVTNYKSIERSFPQLTQVRFHQIVLPAEFLVNFLNLNPQIQNLWLYDVASINRNFATKFTKSMFRLTELHIKDQWNIDLTGLISSEFEFVNLQKLTVWCEKLGEHGDDLLKFTAHTPIIREIEVISYSWIEISNETILELFRRNPCLTHFNAYALDNNPRTSFNQDFFNKLCKITSNRNDLSVKLIVKSGTSFNVVINKRSLSIVNSTIQDEAFCIQKIIGGHFDD